MIFFQFITDHALIVLPAIFGVLLLFAVVNWLINPYKRHNGKINSCRRKIVSYPDKAAKFVNGLPQEYQRQWRAYINTNADKPSQAFEFVRLPNKIYMLRLLIVDAMLLACYIAAFIVCNQAVEFIVCQGAFAVALVLVLVINKIIYDSREKRARQVFARLVAELNSANVSRDNPEQDVLRKTIQQINELNKGEVTKTTLNKASEILRAKGLDNNRTVEEQRRLNTALNGLLQAYARNAKLNVE